MKIRILDAVSHDLLDGARFYEQQCAGLGEYFIDSLFSEIDSLMIYAGIHPVFFGATTGCWQNDFLLPVTTGLLKAKHRSMPCLTAAATQPGTESDSAEGCGKRSEEMSPGPPSAGFGVPGTLKPCHVALQ